ncbi:DUF4124 domain-containing protein [Pseudomonas sp. GV071]|jgi:hypothetical protein|uniref:DUF4124 domain-containing protein n=1 Tax=Pseudomonas sp. GV071 TaxID=2135754 RepID=UPI000D3833DE|nr:DUF4124 domain-containing protein [Pseudomonas sp. GV071]PTQ71179.1 uncharacterized protein DUF4124 [Pseudomonas sp. GV071]
MRLIVTCLLAALTLPASAEIYKYTDANGNTVFTNQPPLGTNAEAVSLPPVNTVKSPPPPTMPGNGQGNAAATQVYEVLEIANLPDAEALRSNDGNLTIDVRIEPQLRIGDSLQLLLDGQPYGGLTNSQQFPLSNIERGEHSVSVQAFSGDRLIQQSPTVTFAIQRVSTNSPARVTPPKPTPRPAN